MSYANTQLLLPMNGANGGTSFPDLSRYNRVISVSGGAQTSTSQSKFYGSSALFDGAADWLQTDYINLSSGDFYIGMYTRLAASQLSKRLFTIASTGTLTAAAQQMSLYFNSAGELRFNGFLSGAAQVALIPTTNIADGAWHHVAVQRVGSAFSLLIDDVEEATDTYAGDFSDSSSWVTSIGGHASNNNLTVDGYIQDLRVISGSTLSVNNSTPPGALLGGTLSNQGTGGEAVKDDTGTAAARRIIAVPRVPSGVTFSQNLLKQTVSDGAGDFTISQVLSASEFSDLEGYAVIALDDAPGTNYNDLVFGKVVPV